MNAAAELDRTLDRRVVVYGSLPPHGRDLDLLVRDGDLADLEAGLHRLGYTQRGAEWTRSRDCDLDVIDPALASEWNLPATERDALFEQARCIDSLRWLRRPAPYHALLIAARRVAGSGRLEEKVADRIRDAVREDPSAPELARAVAAEWDMTEPLELLVGAAPRAPLTKRRRVRAIFDQPRRSGTAPGLGAAATVRVVLRRRRRGTLFSLSGLDGSGKSTQADGLERALRRLGRDPRIEWVPLKPPAPLHHLGRLSKRALRPLARAATATRGERPTAGGQESRVERDLRGSDRREPARVLRRRSVIVATTWSTTVVVAAGVKWGYLLRRRLWRGEDVICDRYLLDAWTFMRYHYQASAQLHRQWHLLALLLPRPDAAFQLEIPPELASARKRDFTPEQNARRAGYYEEKAPWIGAVMVDATRSQAEICAEIYSRAVDHLER